MKLFACFDKYTRFGRAKYILAHTFMERTDAEEFVNVHKGMLMKVFEEVEEPCISQS